MDDALQHTLRDGDFFFNCRRGHISHPRFGDLSASDAVVMDSEQPVVRYQEEEGLFFHLTVTGRCYARCLGCINGELSCRQRDNEDSLRAMEAQPERDAALIAKLAAAAPPDTVTTLAFYGGEPFLAAASMERIRLLLNAALPEKRLRYMVYTSGELLAAAIERRTELMRRMWLFSISIDGDEQQHAAVRPGTNLAAIRNNLRALARGCYGHRLFWSTLREQQSLLNCFETFMDMYAEGLVNQFFWHWADTADPFSDIHGYTERYGTELEQIMESYVSRLAERGEVLPVVHLNELILYLLSGKERGTTACAVEQARNFDVVGGRVYACADLPPALGEVEIVRDEHSIPDLSSLVRYKHGLGCGDCGVHAYCGGRCPVQALSGSPQRTLQICALMRLHVGIVQERIGEIKALLERHNITLQDIYDRSAHFARYTDVVP